MNAQSSRSHAIFSLTLTQRKYTGSGHPSPPSPTPSGSRISRPSGLPTRNVTSPTPGSRSATPTGDRPGSRFGLRPPSVLGRAASPAPGDESGGIDQWLTLTSKFHFVDLAGSERVRFIRLCAGWIFGGWLTILFGYFNSSRGPPPKASESKRVSRLCASRFGRPNSSRLSPDVLPLLELRPPRPRQRHLGSRGPHSSAPNDSHPVSRLQAHPPPPRFSRRERPDDDGRVCLPDRVQPK